MDANANFKKANCPLLVDTNLYNNYLGLFHFEENPRPEAPEVLKAEAIRI